MRNVTLTYDMTGYAGYDPANPTREAEKLCFLLNKNLANLAAENIEIAQSEDSDMAELELFAQNMYDDMLAQGFGEPPASFRGYPTVSHTNDEKIAKCVSILRAALLRRIDEKASSGEEAGGDVAEELQNIVNQLKIYNQGDHMIYLSDGTPIYGKTGEIA